jgi:ADP-heptose:LPS heptosyltransferase
VTSGGKAIARVLVIKLGALGDVVQAMGAMAAIRRHHQDAHITVLTTPPYADLFRSSPYADDVWVDTRPSAWQVIQWLALRHKLRRGQFDFVYDLQTSDRSGTYYRLMGPGTRPNWSGIVRGASHPHDNPARDEMHTLDRLSDQLRVAGIAEVPAPDVSWLHADAARFKLRDPYVLLVPGGSAGRPEKRWPVASYATLAMDLSRRNVMPVVLGTAAEKPLAAIIRKSCASVRDLTGETSFGDLAALARDAAGAVGNDTGPMHLIAVAGAPSVVLFSNASNPALCAPRGKAVRTLRRTNLTALSVGEVTHALLAVAESG